MSTTGQTAASRLKYHTDGYRFVFEALHHTQQKLKRPATQDLDDDRAHITGQELAEGARELALERYGLLARNVLGHWGIKSTADFGRMVFEMIERGEMRKTDRDQLSDFFDVYDFEDALVNKYQILADEIEDD
ncbi:MAG: hypothetical protein KDA80_11600 [Planctomycetaceae bacterium]|nr:hypothetical protein [Planctomycetaceae bacterium]